MEEGGNTMTSIEALELYNNITFHLEVTNLFQYWTSSRIASALTPSVYSTCVCACVCVLPNKHGVWSQLQWRIFISIDLTAWSWGILFNNCCLYSRGKPQDKCPLCQASYLPEHKGIVCRVCQVSLGDHWVCGCDSYIVANIAGGWSRKRRQGPNDKNRKMNSEDFLSFIYKV